MSDEATPADAAPDEAAPHEAAPDEAAPDIPDGTYDVFVFDAEDDDADPDLLRLGITILAGDRKGDVVALAARGLGVDSIDAIGMPGTLTVVDGRPTLRIDDV